MRQCEIVERYDLNREPREHICADLHISERTFYAERSALLKRSDAMKPHARSAESAVIARSLLAASFQNADQLYQLDALDAAGLRLRGIALTASDENAKVIALSRLVEVEFDAGHFDAADAALHGALAAAERSVGELTNHARAELLNAQARSAFARQDGKRLDGAVDQVWMLSAQARDDPELWLNAARACSRAGVYRYIERDIAGAGRMCSTAATALQRTSGAQALARCRLLTTRALVDTHDPERVHLAWAENGEAYRLAIENGMITSACDALYNTLLFMVYCDEPLRREEALEREVPDLAHALAITSNDAMVEAIAKAAQRRFDEAIALLGRARAEYHQGTFDWNPAFTTLHARILFKARRFGAAETVARAAERDWGHSGLRGEGAALRVRAEALEALGRRRAATDVIMEALGALESFSPVHHQLAAYQCAHRLTHRPAFRERVEYLGRAVAAMSPIAFWSSGPAHANGTRTARRLSPRERQVALLAADGLSNPSIASSLGISPKTVANHLATIFERLNLRARWQLSRSLLEAEGG